MLDFYWFYLVHVVGDKKCYLSVVKNLITFCRCLKNLITMIMIMQTNLSANNYDAELILRLKFQREFPKLFCHLKNSNGKHFKKWIRITILFYLILNSFVFIILY